MKTTAFALVLIVPFFTGEGEFCIDAAPNNAPSTEVVYQASGALEIEICITNDGPATMTVTTKCADTQDLQITVGVNETKCQCCKIKETKVSIPQNSLETCGSYTTGSCTAPVE